MQIGDYVRTKSGYIAKIININDFREPSMKYVLEQPSWNDDVLFIGENAIIKSSPNIFDVLALGDFVKIEYYSHRYEERVERIFEIDFDEMNSICFINGHCHLDVFNGEWANGDKELNPIIKSIVTKEQFKCMEYKVGDNE